MTTVIGALPAGVEVLDTRTFRGALVIVTNDGVWMARDGKLEKLQPPFGPPVMVPKEFDIMSAGLNKPGYVTWRS